MEHSTKGEEVTESIAQRAKLELEEKKVELKVVNQEINKVKGENQELEEEIIRLRN